jgi:ribosomal protein S27E
MSRAIASTDSPTAPSTCPTCGSVDFYPVGYGLWDGKNASGVFYKVKCRSCGKVWYGTLTHDQADRGEQPEWIECTW